MPSDMHEMLMRQFEEEPSVCNFILFLLFKQLCKVHYIVLVVVIRPTGKYVKAVVCILFKSNWGLR